MHIKEHDDGFMNTAGDKTPSDTTTLTSISFTNPVSDQIIKGDFQVEVPISTGGLAPLVNQKPSTLAGKALWLRVESRQSVEENASYEEDIMAFIPMTRLSALEREYFKINSRADENCRDRYGVTAYGVGNIMLRWHTIEGIRWLSISFIHTILPFRGMKVGSMLTEYAYERAGEFELLHLIPDIPSKKLFWLRKDIVQLYAPAGIFEDDWDRWKNTAMKHFGGTAQTLEELELQLGNDKGRKFRFRNSILRFLSFQNFFERLFIGKIDA